MLILQKSVGFLPRFGGMCLFLLQAILVHPQEQAVSRTVNMNAANPRLGPKSWECPLPMGYHPCGGQTFYAPYYNME